MRLGGPRQAAVLALLVLDAGKVVSTDRIVTEIWGDQPPDGARDSLYTYVSNLRGILGRERIVRKGSGYRLDLTDRDEIDAVVFERSAGRAGRLLGSDPTAAGRLLGMAIDLWRGRPYEGLEDLVSVAPEASRLEELRLTADEDRIEAELLAGSTPTVGDVELLCEKHPYRERLWGLLARSLYRDHRQAEALRTFTRLRLVLGEELGIEPSSALVRLEEQILLHDPALEPEAAPSPTNLPKPVSSFLGRVDDLILLNKAIHKHRLVTVVGPGGVGKTRLAIEAAWNALGSFPDGVWFVDLAQVSGPGAVPQAVAAAVEAAERPGLDLVDAIAKYLRPRTALLVLDNCEHVVDAAASVATMILENAPDVKILATSRRAIEREGETRFPIEGLSIGLVNEAIDDAERLFEERAASAHRGFTLDETNRPPISSICRHLDGMPLAIELAAVRTDVLSPLEIDRLLADRFALLADDRRQRSTHQTLLSSLDWSYDMLPSDDQAAFDTLGVFEGPFSAAAAATVLGVTSEIETADRLSSLIGASLLQIAPSDAEPTLYRLLETVRMYAREHMNEGGRWETVVAAHDNHYHDQCRGYRGSFFGQERVEAQHQIKLELADHHAAFDRLFARGDAEDCLEMGWPLGHLWLFAGRISEGARRLEAVLEASAGSQIQARADCLTAASWLVMFRQDFGQAVAWVDEAIAIYRLIDDAQGLAYAMARRGHLAFAVGDGPTAMQMLQESLSLCQKIGYNDGTAWPLTLLAQARRWSGEESPEIRDMLEDGRERFIAMGETYGQVHADMLLGSLVEEGLEYRLRHCEEMVRLGEEPGADRLIRPIAFHNLAYAVWDAGQLDRAEGLNRAAARTALETGATVNSGLALLQAATFAGRRGDAASAATLFGAGNAHFMMQQAPFMKRLAQPVIEAAKHNLGKDRYQELYEHGAKTSVEEATDFLLKS